MTYGIAAGRSTGITLPDYETPGQRSFLIASTVSSSSESITRSAMASASAAGG